MLAPPEGADWAAEIAWELYTEDGTRRAWTSGVTLLPSASTAASAALPATVSVPAGTVGLLIGRVTYRSETRGQRVIGLGGRTVEVTARGLIPSEEPFEGSAQPGPLPLPDDWVPSDVEVQ